MKAYRAFSFPHLATRLCVALIGLVTVSAATTAFAGSKEANDPSYLALGDSVVFGYITQNGPAYLNPDNFNGYPAYVGQELDLGNANAGCPGETTASFITGSVPDNGCRDFRSRFLLHAAYPGSQLAFATDFLAKHRKTRLVTIGLGANDGFLVQRSCAGDPNPAVCFQQKLPGLLATIVSNMETILGSLRATGYRGALMVVNYYSLDYADPAQTGLTVLVNQALAASAAASGAMVGDAFTAFQNVANGLSVPFKGKTCFTGLLNGNPSDPSQMTCDVHPSLTGQQLLADAVEATFQARQRIGDD